MGGAHDHTRDAARGLRAGADARAEAGIATIRIVTAIAVLGVAALTLLVLRPSAANHANAATTNGSLQAAGGVLERDLSASHRVVLDDASGCDHPIGERAAISFLGSAAASTANAGGAETRASWYAEDGPEGRALVRRSCVAARLVETAVVVPIAGVPVVACEPRCADPATVRLSFSGPQGPASVVAYRKLAA